MSSVPNEFRDKLIQLLAEHGRESYKENARILALIEDKAQKTATVAGVFVGVSITLINSGASVVRPALTGSRFMLPLGVVLLICSVFASLLSMRVQYMSTLTDFTAVDEFVRGIIAHPDLMLEHEKLNHLVELDLLSPWVEILSDQKSKIKKKGTALNIAQSLLAVAVFNFGGYAAVNLMLARSV